LKFESDAINATGENTDIMENAGWRAIKDPDQGYTIQICSFSA